MAKRLGELRHEEFSHYCVNESVGREKFRRTLLYNFSRTIIVKFLEKGGEQNKNSENCSKKVISCFPSVLFLVLSDKKQR